MTNWNARLELIGNQQDLLMLSREFVDSWEPDELALLPEHARPQRIKGIDDLAHWHQRLVDCYCQAPLRNREIEKVREMLHFFAIAIQRAAELDGVPPIGEHSGAARIFSERSVPRLFTSAMSGAAER